MRRRPNGRPTRISSGRCSTPRNSSSTIKGALAVHAPNRLGCPEFRRLLAIERGSFVKVGVLGLAGLSLADLLRAESKQPNASREKSVIILWMRGGPSQHETWDPKPDAPAEIRGEFGSIATPVPGVRLCDLLPMSAKVMKKWSIIRSLNHHDAGHSA